jgi:hypothetical protein
MSTVLTLIKAEEIVNQGIAKATPQYSRFDANKFAPNIAQAELRFLKSSISPSSSGFVNSEFFDDLLAQKNSIPSCYNPQLGGIVKAYPNNADYETLWTQWLLPYLSKAAYYESLEGIVMNFNNNGVHLIDTQHGLWDDTDYCSECSDKEQTGRKGGFVTPNQYKNK